jgi:gamma-glutamylputrescine oxidase
MSRLDRTWYAASAEKPASFPSAEGDIYADVCIIGAGFTGISAAIELAKQGRKVIVLEAETIGHGASGRNGGQVIFGYSCDQSKIEKELGFDDSKKLFDWSIEAIELIKQRCSEYQIDCDWRNGHLHAALHQRHWRELQHWQKDLQRYSYSTDFWNQEQLREQINTDRYIGGLFDARSGHIHPLKYLYGLANAAKSHGAYIYEHSRVVKIEYAAKAIIQTDKASIRADFLIYAGNALLGKLEPALHYRVMPVGSYVGATQSIGKERAEALIRNQMAVADINWALDYFRFSADYRLLFGGRASYSTLPPPNLRGVMRSRMNKVFPSLKDIDFEYLWGGYIDISLSRAPHWGRLKPNVYFAQGFSGHGVATSGLAGKIIAESILMQSQRIDVYEKLKHLPFPGGHWFRTPMLVVAMSWYKLRDALW